MMKRIKNRIAHILEQQNITPYRMAKLLGVPAPTVYNWCKNKSNPSQRYMVDIMRILGVTLDDVLEVEV